MCWSPRKRSETELEDRPLSHKWRLWATVKAPVPYNVACLGVPVALLRKPPFEMESYGSVLAKHAGEVKAQHFIQGSAIQHTVDIAPNTLRQLQYCVVVVCVTFLSIEILRTWRAQSLRTS